jgi:hypothetical protein
MTSNVLRSNLALGALAAAAFALAFAIGALASTSLPDFAAVSAFELHVVVDTEGLAVAVENGAFTLELEF